MANALQNFAALLVKKSYLVEAKAKYEQATAIHSELGDSDSISFDRLKIAEIAMEENRPGEVEPVAHAAVEISRKGKSSGGQVHAHTILARAFLMEGKLKEAAAEIEQAKALWEKSRGFNQHFDIGIVSARILAQSSNSAEAIKQLNILLDEATRSGLVGYQFEISLALGEIEMQTGKTSSAATHLKSLEKDASAKGFLLIANKAKAAVSDGRSVSKLKDQ